MATAKAGGGGLHCPWLLMHAGSIHGAEAAAAGSHALHQPLPGLQQGSSPEVTVCSLQAVVDYDDADPVHVTSGSGFPANMMPKLTKLGGAGTAEVACTSQGITGRLWWNMWEAVQALAVVS